MQKPKCKKLCIVATLLLVLSLWIIWGNTAIEITRIALSSSNLPSQFSGLRIAHISDLHNAEFGAKNITLLQKISEEKPDIIAITGDLIDANRTNIDIALSFAQQATQIAPTYYVTGNHEAWISQYNELKAGLEEAGVTVLEDESIQLRNNGNTLTILGLSDPDFGTEDGIMYETSAMVGDKLSKMAEEGYTILLSHRPELFETYVENGIDLVLSGHAHGGQFRLPLIGGLVAPNQGPFPKYDAGLYTAGETNMVVSRGLGNSIIPVRLNNRPEIMLVELEN